MILSPAELADLEDLAAIARNSRHPEKAQEFGAFVADLRAGQVS